MGGKHKKFIDKKRDVIHTFKVVPRSQRDPLVADEDAPQNVLVDTNFETAQTDELKKYGIYFDDDYDYLQHLRGVKDAVEWEEYDVEVYTIKDSEINEPPDEESGLVLPSSVFESYVEEPIGLLNRAAPVTGPRPELDPDIVAELDKDFDFAEGEIVSTDDTEAFPDDFVSLLNSETFGGADDADEGEFDNIKQWLGGTQCYDDLPPLDEQYEEGIDTQLQCYSDSESTAASAEGFIMSDDEEEEDDVGDLPPSNFRRGPRSDASRTSASSATVPRSELLSILDERFEKLFNDEYTDDQLGALDDDVIEGALDVNSEVFQQAVRSTWKQFQRGEFADIEACEKDKTIHWVKENLKLRNYMEDDEDEEIVTMDMKSKPAFDCESILSTYSNTQNLPHLIDDSHLFKKRKSRLTTKAVKEHNKMEGDLDHSDKEGDEATLLSCISAISFRPKNETPEERRDRKSALKELRRERRQEKKFNKLSFKEEIKKQKKVLINTAKSRIVSVV